MKVFSIVSLVLLSLIIYLVTEQYFFCPVYTFEKQEPFSGDSIYNPYAHINDGKWIKCNFHAHVKCWNGFTNGKGTAEDIHAMYNKLKYDIHAVSNYQYIDTTRQRFANYISSYEHGYNTLKSHQLVIGAERVCWKDYMLPQSLSNKQHILDELDNSAPEAIVVLNHPLIRNGYTPSDVQYLTHYSCMEVLNPSCISTRVWDAALSNGKPVFIVGNDDCHNLSETERVGRMCTWIHPAQEGPKGILSALRTGAGFAMEVGRARMEQQRNGNDVIMPTLRHLFIKSDTVKAGFNLSAKTIVVSGQNGRILQQATDTNAIVFALHKNENYARITATYADGTQIFLNPVFRYSKSPLHQSSAKIDVPHTLWMRSAGIVILVFWLGFLFTHLFSGKFSIRLLPNISPGYGYISGFAFKNNKIRYRRHIGHRRRFFGNMAFERKAKAE